MAYIYKIEINDMIYIGSTRDIKKRQAEHNSFLKRGNTLPIYNYCRENDINILKLVELECVDPEDRFIVEQYYIDEYKTGHNLLNRYNPTFDQKEYQKTYYKENFETIKDKQKTYHQTSVNYKKYQRKYQQTDRMKEYQREYREANKDRIREYQRQYREAQKLKKLNK